MIKIRPFLRNCMILLCTLCSYFPASAVASQSLDHIVAVVNDDIITKLELIHHTKLLLSRVNHNKSDLPPRDILEQQILNQMILDKVQLQLAQNVGIEIDSFSVDEAMKDLANSENLSISEFRSQLTKDGIDFNNFRDYVRTEVTISRLRQREIGQEIVISSTDIDGFLNSPVGQDHTGTEYHLAHILLSASNTPTPEEIDRFQTQADSVVEDLKNGGNFAEVAISKSTSQHALRGGDLGWKRIAELPTLFVKYIPSMQINEIIGPIRSANGFHIIKLMGKRTGDKVTHIEDHVRHILIKPGVNLSDAEAKQNLTAIREKAINGASFAKLAEQKSEELSTAVNGGDLGWVTENSVTSEFYQQVKSLKPGSLSKPFKTELGWHLIELIARRSQDDSTEAARNKATEVIHQRKYNEMLESWLKRVKSEAKIEVISSS